MVEQKTITVRKQTWEKLMSLKTKNNYKTIDEVINMLLVCYEKRK